MPLVVVNLMCDLYTNSARLCSDDRKEVGGKTKLVDVDILEKVRGETSILSQGQVIASGKKEVFSVSSWTLRSWLLSRRCSKSWRSCIQWNETPTSGHQVQCRRLIHPSADRTPHSTDNFSTVTYRKSPRFLTRGLVEKNGQENGSSPQITQTKT